MENRSMVTIGFWLVVSMAALTFIFAWVGRMNTFLFVHHEQQIAECTTQGYTYGECFNVISSFEGNNNFSH